MKKISSEIRAANIFLSISFILIFFIFNYYFSYQIRYEQKNAIRNLQHFVKNEIKSFEKENNGKKAEIKEIVEDIYIDQNGNSDYSINFLYEGRVTAQNEKMVKRFDTANDKVVRDGNYYVLNFKEEIRAANTTIVIQIVNNFSSGITEIKRIEKLFSLSLIILFFIALLINRRFYEKLRKQIESIMYSTTSIDINNFETKIDEKNMYYEFKNMIYAYKTMVEKIKKQTENEIAFVNNASHELKTPIFIINGYIELLERKGIEDREIFEEAVGALKTEVKDISILTEKLLFLARKSYTDISYENIEINEMFLLIKDEMKIVYPESRINIMGNRVELLSDRKLLKQMLRNIIENALKYGNNSDVQIIVSENAENREKKIVITDSGKGLDEEEIKNIFKKFYRSDKSRNRNETGHGLGLSIVAAIAEMLNVKIEVRSIKDEGTSFILKFSEVIK